MKGRIYNEVLNRMSYYAPPEHSHNHYMDENGNIIYSTTPVNENKVAFEKLCEVVEEEIDNIELKLRIEFTERLKAKGFLTEEEMNIL